MDTVCGYRNHTRNRRRTYDLPVPGHTTETHQLAVVRPNDSFLTSCGGFVSVGDGLPPVSASQLFGAPMRRSLLSAARSCWSKSMQRGLAGQGYCCLSLVPLPLSCC